MSLIMLPIYRSHSLVGVLQVLFDDPHAFLDHEVRAYRLMVGALEDAIVHDQFPAKLSEAKAAEKTLDEPIAVPCGVESASPSIFVSESSASSRISASDSDRTVYWQAMVCKASGFWLEFTNEFRARLGPQWGSSFWNSGTGIGTVGAVVALGVAIGLYHHNHRSSSALGVSGPVVIDAQQPAQPAPAVVNAVDQATTVSVDGWKPSKAPSQAFRRVRIGPHEIDYISDDVTIRHFENPTARLQLQKDVKEVSFGRDVTVRYFARPPLTSPADPSETNPSIDRTSPQAR
jgi:hypothetical protein